MARSSSLDKAFSIMCVLAMVCSSASGQVVIAGCANGSCNPTAQGGTAISTSSSTQSTTVEQPAPPGGNPFIDLMGAVLPMVAAKPGRKLMGHQVAAGDSTSTRQLRQLPAGLVVVGCASGSCNPSATGGTAVSSTQTTQTTDIKQAPQESGGNPITDILGGIGDLFGGRKLMGVQEEQGVVAAAAAGMRNLKCVEAPANSVQCGAWGPSQCGMPGVPDRCPCMCGGQGGGSQRAPVVQIFDIAGCKGGSCNPGALGGSARAGR